IMKDIIGLIAPAMAILFKRIYEKYFGSGTKGKDELCKFLLMRIYTCRSLKGINVKEVIDMINRQNRCKVEELFQFTTLSNELCYYLYTQDNGFTYKEKKIIANLIDERKVELDNLLMKEMYSPVKKYFNDNFKWIITLFFIFNFILVIRLYFTEQNYSYLYLILIQIVYMVIAFVVVIGTDVFMWKADMSTSIKQGFLLRFFEKRYHENGFVKAFFDYYSNSK
ncbi:MAG: hypothetical protein ACRC76_13300, partial [Proteocatella sp.]